MKKAILFLGVLCLMSVFVSAQGTLQFNGVKLVGSVETVPEGKVWKVESVFASSELKPTFAGCGNITSISSQILIDGTTVYVQRAMHAHGSGTCSTGQGQSLISDEITKLPLWLPEGKTLAAGTNVYRISVLEFSIVP